MLPKQSSFLNTIFLFIVLLVYSFAFSDEQVCDPQDESSLLTFSTKFSTSSPLNWPSSTSCCRWEGVECDTKGRVISVQLYARGLKGVISSSSTIGNLVSLTHLNLSNNELSGPLGEGILAITNLRVLDLSVNNISGLIPREIGNLLHLERLHLGDNNFSGPIPPRLMNCTKLVEIILRNNNLYGDISTLDMSKLVQLQKLDLFNNFFSGTLPASIYLCNSLTAIRVAANHLTGQISPGIVKLKSLSYLSLALNSFTNITRAFTILANCNNLTTLFLGFNFHGEALPSYSNLLGSNGLPRLQYFSLNGCNLTGSFPEWLSSIKTLQVLSLNNNRFTGEIPDSMGDLPNLFILNISTNNLSGEIPPKLYQLPALMSKQVDLKLNRLNLELPSYTFRKQFEHFTMSPSALSLSNNKFSGYIPPEIGKLQGLQQLQIANNHFSGNIPASIANLTNLEVLDLSGNNLMGEIPGLLTNLTFLRQLNLSYNDLEGPIPTGGQFETFQQTAFEGNPRLCGDLIQKPCWKTAKPEDNGQPLKGQPFLNGLYVGFALGFSGVLVIAASYVGC